VPDNDNKVKFNIGTVPTDIEGRLKLVLDLYRRLTGKEPTEASIIDARRRLESGSHGVKSS
jgi:hypothetical protein